MEELYGTNPAVTAEDEGELGHTLPDPAQLPTPRAFADAVWEQADLESRDHTVSASLWTEPQETQQAQQLEDAMARLEPA